MANETISALTAVSIITGDEIAECVQSGSKKWTFNQFKAWFFEQAPTFAAISASTDKRFVFVAADETNDNLPTLYFDDGTNLNWIPMVEV